MQRAHCMAHELLPALEVAVKELREAVAFSSCFWKILETTTLTQNKVEMSLLGHFLYSIWRYQKHTPLLEEQEDSTWGKAWAVGRM